MAGIPRTDSIIADSTASSSSPSRPIAENPSNSDASTLIVPPNQVKRVSRTYGRPKPDTNIGDAFGDNIGSRARILKTAPRDADNHVIPESDDVVERAPSFGGFDWRAKLKAIDDDFDDSGELNATDQAANTSASSNDAPDVPHITEGSPYASVLAPLSGLSHLSLTGPAQQATGALPTADGDSLFSGSQLTLLTSDPPPGSPLFSASRNLLTNDSFAPETIPQRSHKRVLTSPEASGSENASPKHPYAINSPNNRSSPTPPTSPLADPNPNDVAASEDDSVDDGSKPEEKSRLSKKGKTKEKAKSRSKRMKAPTKKDVLESRKESARLLADQHVSIPRTEAQPVHTIANLFNKLKSVPTTVKKQDSDPITSFSSPGHLFPTPGRKLSLEDASPLKPTPPTTAVSSSRAKAITSHPSQFGSTSEAVELPTYDASDEEMPDPDVLLRAQDEKLVQLASERTKRAEAERRAKDLEDRKRKALELSKLRSGSEASSSKAGPKARAETDSDDDLEIVEDMVSVDAPPRGHVRKGLHSSVQRSHLGGGGRRVEKGSGSSSRIVSQKSLELAARPAFIASSTKTGSKRKAGQGSSVSHKDLNSLLLQRAGKQSGVIEEQKKEEWVKAGGVLRGQHSGFDAPGKSLTDWLHQGAIRDDAMVVDEEYDEDEDAEDPEYTPEDGEGRGIEHSGEEDEYEAPAENSPVERDMDVSDDEPSVDTDKENHRPATRRQPARVIVDSDEEEPDDHAGHLRPRHVVLAPDTSFAEDSGDSPGEDKENSAELAFDLSEDKENASVPRHLPRGRVVRADDAPPSPGTPDGNGVQVGRRPLGSLDVEGESPFMPPLAQRRDSSQGRILQVLHEEDRHSPLSPVTPIKKSVFRRRTSSSSPGSVDEHLEGPKPFLGGGFSQLFTGNDNAADNEELAPVTALGGGFSQFFSPGGVARDRLLLSEGRTPHVNRPGLAQDDDFQFTQTSTLLPSVKISESQRREVDEMFGKDQEFKLDEAKRSREDAKPSETSIPGSLDFRSLAPSQPTQPSPQSIRRPLETLSLDPGDADVLRDASPSDMPSRRGRLVRERPERPQASPSPSPKPRNAFDILRDAAKGKAKEHPLKPRLEKSDFVEAEAQESDDEAMLGFGGAKGEDDEEGADEDPDAVVEGLVDDTTMDVKAQAVDLVLEKHMEHQAEDDAAIEKLHQDAVAGKLRGKRRDRGLGFEESDSEDEGYKGPRKPLYKKRRIEGDTLESYGQNPETRAFYDTYQAELAEEADPRLAHLQQTGSDQMQEGVESDVSEDESETVDSAEIRRRLRELPKREVSMEPERELNDLTWIEEDEDMADDFKVEERPFRIKKSAPDIRPSLDHLDYLGAYKGKKPGTAEQVQLKSWATQEARSHSSASGRGGFSRKEDGNGGVSQKQRRVASTSKVSAAAGGDTRAVVKRSSVLSHIEKRKGFDS